MSEIKNYFVQGAVLIDVDGAALNNMGVEKSSLSENATAVKLIKKGRESYPFISGQAWRYWWRESCAMLGWNLSPITKDGKVYYTSARPDTYEDDDVFGYMRAASDTFTRVSPLKNSVLVSVIPTKPLEEFAIMGRQHQDGDNPAPYGKQSYSAVMKGLFSIDLDQVGTFTSVSRSGYQNISKETFDELVKDDNNKPVDDLIHKDIQRVRLASNKRIKRIIEALQALKTISGGAKRTTNYNSVKPDFIVLSILKGGNNPFDNIAINDDGKATISEIALAEVIKDNKDYFRSGIYIGKASGFMDSFSFEALKNYISDDELTSKINFGSINEAIDKFVVENIEKIIMEMDS